MAGTVLQRATVPVSPTTGWGEDMAGVAEIGNARNRSTLAYAMGMENIRASRANKKPRR
jgi:hypothetical protein